jgi:hypothetical protein
VESEGILSLRDWLTDRIAAYDLRGPNDFERLKRHIRKGDVLLVEGDQRVSAVIKYLTQSSWSHAALYIGDELVRRGGEQRDSALASFGDEAQHLLVEALVDGVVASPVSKYTNFNIRLCRPHRLRAADLAKILDDAIATIGWRYDLRNIVDLAIHLFRVSILPRRFQLDALSLGSDAWTEVICTSLLGRLFHMVNFPVLPSVTFPEPPRADVASRWPILGRRRRRRRCERQSLYDGVFHRRHPTLLTPRDFDLSPYFDIVKFNVIEDGAFDYLRIAWADDAQAGDGGD